MNSVIQDEEMDIRNTERINNPLIGVSYKNMVMEKTWKICKKMT